MKKLSPADKFRRRLAAMKKAANKSKKDTKFFEHDVRLNEGEPDGEPPLNTEPEPPDPPGIIPDSSTNPEESQPAAGTTVPSPTSSVSSGEPKMKSTVYVNQAPRSNNYFKKRKTLMNNNRKKFLKKLRQLQHLQAHHPALYLPAASGNEFRQLTAALSRGPTGNQCCCQCACSSNNNLELQLHHHPHRQQESLPQQQQYLPSTDREAYSESSLQPPTGTDLVLVKPSNENEGPPLSTPIGLPNHFAYNHHHHHPNDQYYHRHRLPPPQPPLRKQQLPLSQGQRFHLQRRPGRESSCSSFAMPYCTKEMHSVVRYVPHSDFHLDCSRPPRR